MRLEDVYAVGCANLADCPDVVWRAEVDELVLGFGDCAQAAARRRGLELYEPAETSVVCVAAIVLSFKLLITRTRWCERMMNSISNK